jgi:hypothetical protein
MRVLSVEDIDLMITLVSSQKVLKVAGRHEQQLDKLISMGIIRPGGGVLALTELGQKTAHALLGHSLGSSRDSTLADAPVDEAPPLDTPPQAAAVPAAAEPAADVTAETATEAASGNDTPALETN